MKSWFFSGQLFLVLVVVANAASVNPTEHLKWPSSSDELSSINFYKQFYVYVQAVMNEGIPALNVAPLDPMYFDSQLSLFQERNPQFPNYSNMEVLVNGINVSDFSKFNIDSAYVIVDDLFAAVSLSANVVALSSDDIRATALNSDGRVLWCNCSYAKTRVHENNIVWVKQLQVKGTILQMKEFFFRFRAEYVNIIGPLGCSGDDELKDYMSYILAETLANFVFNDLQPKLNAWAENVSTVLDDILALRNITYENDTMASENASHEVHQLRDKVSKAEGVHAGKVIQRSRMHADHQNSARTLRENRMNIKWTN